MFEKWIQMGLDKGLEDLEIYSVQSRELNLSIYKSKLEEYQTSKVHELNIRGIYEGKYATVYVENLTDDNISYYLDQLIENAKAVTVDEPAIIYKGDSNYPAVKINNNDFSKVDFDKKLNLLLDVERLVEKDEYVSQVEGTSYSESESIVTIVNSKGLNLTRSKKYVLAYVFAVFQKAEETKTAFSIRIKDCFDKLSAEEIAEEAIVRGRAKLGGKPLKSGLYDVVLSNRTSTNLLSAFSSIYSGSAAYKKLTKLNGRVGDKIASEKVTIMDDPLCKDALFNYAFDDEGVSCKTKSIIEKGVFKGFLHSLKTAAILNEAPTGNGFGGGVWGTNTYVVPSDVSFDEMIAPIKEGVYITELAGIHAGVQTTSGDFSLQAQGFYIKDGKISHPLKMMVVSGNIFKILASIKEVASDLHFSDLGGYGSPSVYAGKLPIAG